MDSMASRRRRARLAPVHELLSIAGRVFPGARRRRTPASHIVAARADACLAQ